MASSFAVTWTGHSGVGVRLSVSSNMLFWTRYRVTKQCLLLNIFHPPSAVSSRYSSALFLLIYISPLSNSLNVVVLLKGGKTLNGARISPNTLLLRARSSATSRGFRHDRILSPPTLS